MTAWREDVQTLARELPARHVEPWFTVTEATWRGAVAELDGRLVALDDAQIEAELMRLVAMLGDGHTLIGRDPPLRPAYYPLALQWFEDGIFVLDAAGDAAWAKGQEVVAIGGKPIEDAIGSVSAFLSHDNHGQLQNQMSNALIDPVLVRSAGLAETTTAARYTMRAADGTERDAELAPAPPWRPKLPAKDLPLAMQRRHSHYWNDYLDGPRLLYFQYNVCADAKDLPFADLAASTLAFADQKPIDKFVIDLRHNGGGNSQVITPLIDGLAARPELAGKVYVIIGRRTFSSAVLNAIALKRRLGAILVGEPTGGKPSHHGEVLTFPLPHSRLVVQYSTKYHANPDFTGDAVMPDLPVAVRHADWLALRDPVLDAIAAHSR